MIRDTTIYVFSRALPALLTLGSIALLTRYLTPAEFGRYSLALALAGFLNVLLMTWNLQGFYRLHSIYRGRRAIILDGATATGFVLSVVFGIALAGVLLPLFATGFGWEYTFAAAALFPGLAALELTSFRLNSARLPWSYFALQLARATGNLLAGGLVAYLTGSVVLVLLAVATWWLAAASIGGMASWLTRLRLTRAQWMTMRRMLGYGAPLTVAAALYSAVSILERFMLDQLAGPAAVGELAAGTDIVQFSVGAIGSAVALSTYPRIMALYSRGGIDFETRLVAYSSHQIAIILPLAVGAALVAEPVASILLGEQIRVGAAAVMPWAAVGIFFSVLKGFYLDFSFQLARWTVGITIVAGAMITTVFVLNLILIPLNGAVGTAQASAIGFVLAAALSYVLGRRHALAMPFYLPDVTKIAVATAFMGVVIYFVEFTSPIGTLVTKIAIGGAAYFSALVLINPFDIRKIGASYLVQARVHWRNG